MSLQVENLEHNMAKVTIEVEAAKLDDAIKQAFNKKKGQFNVPGFRKGKVPFQLIAKEYGVEIFYEDAANILIPDAYAEAMKDTDLEIVSRPEIDVTQLEKGKDFIFTATFALKPEVTLGDYKGIEVPKTRVTVKKDEIEEELKKVQEQNAREITIEDRAVKDGDILTIDYSGSVDGVKFEGGTAEDQTLVIGSGAFIPGFEEQLVGKNLNETADINVTFPEEYHAPDLAGKESNLQGAQTGITKELMNIKTQTESVGVSAKTLGALAESIGASATDVGNQAGAIGEFIKNNYSSLTDEQKAQLTTIAGSLKTDAENLGGYAQSVGGQAKNLGTYAGSIGTSLQETQTDLQIVSGCLTQIQNLLTKTKTSTAQLEAALKQIAEGTGQLKTSSKTLASSIKKLDEGAKTLNSGTKTAANGAKKLSKGAKTLDNGMGQMTTGIATLKNGAVTLNKGMLTFRKDGIEKLVNTINDDAKDILDRVDAVMDEGENYQTFTKKASGTKGSVKFIIETEELEK